MLYDWLKALHLISVFAWMAGMLYLPRIYVYHCGAAVGSEASETFKVMERRLLRAIINPAMIASYVFGIWMLTLNPGLLKMPYFHIKLTALVLMQITHAMLARARKQFAQDRNPHSARYYRILNEVPTVLLIIIVIMVIVRPQL